MSEHDCNSCGGGCGCGDEGCGHDHGEELKVTLTLDDNEEMVCLVVGIFPAGEYEYIALMPEESEEGDVYLYRYEESPEGDPILDNIETEEEYETAAAKFEDLLDGAGYEE